MIGLMAKVQLVRVPYFQDFTVLQKLTCLPWDGSKGGVLAFNVQNTLTLNADIDVGGKGFRKGVSINSNNINWVCGSANYYYPSTSIESGAKGEGIANISLEKSRGKRRLGKWRRRRQPVKCWWRRWRKYRWWWIGWKSICILYRSRWKGYWWQDHQPASNTKNLYGWRWRRWRCE